MYDLFRSNRIQFILFIQNSIIIIKYKMLRIRYFLIRRERSFWDNLMRISTFSQPLYNIIKDTDDISDIVRL